MGRGTRFNRSQTTDQGVLSGTTVATYPSGTTLTRGATTFSASGVSAAGTVYTTGDVVCDGIDTGSGTPWKINSGVTNWPTAATTSITHGFTTLTAMTATLGNTGATLHGYVVIDVTDVISTGVSVAVRNGAALVAGGASIQWIAIGI